MAPDFGTKVYCGEDGRGIYPDVVEDVGAEGSNERKGVVVEVGDAGKVAKEVPINELLLWDPEFLTTIVDDCVLVGMAVDGEGTGGSREEVWEDVG